MRHLDLFSGIGGFALAAKWAAWETIAFCECETFCQKVLAKHWPEVPCFKDVKEMKATDVGAVDIITGGYPCQPFSTAGAKRGKNDDRHLWPEMFRLINKLRPTWVVGENVVGHANLGLHEVLSDLEGIRYQARAFIIPACAVDAPHIRDRVWVLAHAESFGHRQGRETGDVFEEVGGQVGQLLPQLTPTNWWPSEPGMGRVADGVPNRVDRVKSLGNAIVPQVAFRIFQAINQLESPTHDK